jgi:hypothetical protein
MLDTTRDVVRKSLLAMLGAITLADDELEQLLDRLAARGEQVARDRFSHIEALRNRLTGSEGAAREGLYEGALLRQTLREEIERQGRLLAAALDLPTRDSINLLREQIEQISLAIDQIVTQRTRRLAPRLDNGQTPGPNANHRCPSIRSRRGFCICGSHPCHPARRGSRTRSRCPPATRCVPAPSAAVPNPMRSKRPPLSPNPMRSKRPPPLSPNPMRSKRPPPLSPNPMRSKRPPPLSPNPMRSKRPPPLSPNPMRSKPPAAAVPNPMRSKRPSPLSPNPEAVEAPPRCPPTRCGRSACSRNRYHSTQR